MSDTRPPLDDADRNLSMAERIGQASMNLLDHIADDFPDGEVELETVAIVVSLRVPQGAELNGETVESEYGHSFLRYYCEDPRRWVQAGLLDEAWRAARD